MDDFYDFKVAGKHKQVRIQNKDIPSKLPAASNLDTITQARNAKKGHYQLSLFAKVSGQSMETTG